MDLSWLPSGVSGKEVAIEPVAARAAARASLLPMALDERVPKAELKEVGLRTGEEVLLRLVAVRVVAAGGAGEGHRAALRAAGAGGLHGELGDQVADLERIHAIERHRHGDRVVRVERVDEVRHAPAPARLERLVRNAALPLGLLVVVREELGWQLDTLRLVLGHGGGFDQGADVGEDRQFSALQRGSSTRRSTGAGPKERPSEVFGRIGSRVDCGKARAVRALA
jgi:hypothetical protein